MNRLFVVALFSLLIEGASSNIFQVLTDEYAKDTWNTYFRGKKIK